LSWGNDGPQRSPDELLALVRAKADRIRWRRRLGVASGAIAVTAVLLASVALASPGGGGRTKVQTLGPATTSAPGTGGSDTTLETPATQSTVTDPTAAAPAATTTTTSAATGPAATPPTTHPPASTVPSTTRTAPTVASTTTTSITAAQPPQCQASDLVVTATSDRTSYSPGQTASFTVAARYLGAGSCALGRDPGMTISDAAGKSIESSMMVDLCTFYVVPGPPPCLMAPGDVKSAVMTWTHTVCSPSGSPCPAAGYRADLNFGEIKAATVTFALT